MPTASKFTLFCLRSEIWLTARILPAWIGKRDLESIFHIADAQKVTRYGGIDPEIIAKFSLAATRKHWIMRNRRCLRQGVLGYRFLSKAGHHPELHLGIGIASTQTETTQAHCWVVLDEAPIVNDTLDDMVTLHIHKSPSEAA